jgi:hypothetical protein
MIFGKTSQDKKQEVQPIISEPEPLLSDVKLEFESEVEPIILPEIVNIPINVLKQNKNTSKPKKAATLETNFKY